MRTLIIVDMQKDFVTGSLATDPQESFVEHTAEWLGEAADTYDYIVTTQDWHETAQTEHIEVWGEHCMADTPGAELHPLIEDALTQGSFERFLKGQRDHGYSGFEGISGDGVFLGEWLQQRGATEIDVIGIATEHCVRATAFDAMDGGYTVRVVREYVNAVDAVAGQELLDGGFQDRGVVVV